MGLWDGDIIFKTPQKEFLRLKGDGTFVVEGRPSDKDKALIDAFRRWILHTSVELADRRSGRIEPKGFGDFTFSSGTGVSDTGRGGDVVLTIEASKDRLDMENLKKLQEDISTLRTRIRESDAGVKFRELCEARRKAIELPAVRTAFMETARSCLADLPWVKTIRDNDHWSRKHVIGSLTVVVDTDAFAYQPKDALEQIEQCLRRFLGDLVSIVEFSIDWNGYEHAGPLPVDSDRI